MSIQLDQAKKTGRKIILWVVLGLVGCYFLYLAGCYIYRTYTVSEGTRTGILFKISKKGFMFKTYEGQLQLGGNTMMTQQSVWEFSAKNAAVYQQLQQYEGKNVKCYYHQEVDAFPWEGDTDYIVYKAELVNQ